jgi:hypothetical protein
MLPVVQWLLSTIYASASTGLPSYYWLTTMVPFSCRRRNVYYCCRTLPPIGIPASILSELEEIDLRNWLRWSRFGSWTTASPLRVQSSFVHETWSAKTESLLVKYISDASTTILVWADQHSMGDSPTFPTIRCMVVGCSMRSEMNAVQGWNLAVRLLMMDHVVVAA